MTPASDRRRWSVSLSKAVSICCAWKVRCRSTRAERGSRFPPFFLPSFFLLMLYFLSLVREERSQSWVEWRQPGMSQVLGHASASMQATASFLWILWNPCRCQDLASHSRAHGLLSSSSSRRVECVCDMESPLSLLKRGHYGPSHLVGMLGEHRA